MTSFNFLEEVMELPYVAACVARCNNADKFRVSADMSVDLLARLIDTMTTTEMILFRDYYRELQFSKPGINSPL